MSDLRPGVRVRYSMEGVVEGMPEDRLGWFMRVRDDGGRAWVLPRPSPDRSAVVAVEVIPHPEAWSTGDVVISPSGGLYRRVADSGLPWRSLGATPTLVSESIPERPLTLLVRGGKPVQP